MAERINYYIFKAREFDPNNPISSPFVVFSTENYPKGKELLGVSYSERPNELGSSLIRKIQNDHGEFPRDIRYSLSTPADGSIHKEQGRLQNLIYEKLSPDERESFLESLGVALKEISGSSD